MNLSNEIRLTPLPDNNEFQSFSSLLHWQMAKECKIKLHKCSEYANVNFREPFK